jgi:hypothetical protein
MGFQLTQKELILACAIALMGFVFSSRWWILGLSSMTPIQGLVMYYIILYTSLYILSRAGLIIYDIRIENVVQVFGLLLITFSFFITVDWESQWVQYITNGNIEQASPVFYQSEDGAIMYLWSRVVPMVPQNMELLRILTYVVTPFILVVIGAYLVARIEF